MTKNIFHKIIDLYNFVLNNKEKIIDISIINSSDGIKVYIIYLSCKPFLWCNNVVYLREDGL